MYIQLYYSPGAELFPRGAPERTKRMSIVSKRRDEIGKGRTDWKRVEAQTDQDIERAVADDADAVPLDIDWSEAELVVPPKKQPISIRIDEDVIDWFRRSGPGYQTRINSILRHYMRQKTSV